MMEAHPKWVKIYPYENRDFASIELKRAGTIHIWMYLKKKHSNQMCHWMHGLAYLPYLRNNRLAFVWPLGRLFGWQLQKELEGRKSRTRGPERCQVIDR